MRGGKPRYVRGGSHGRMVGGMALKLMVRKRLPSRSSWVGDGESSMRRDGNTKRNLRASRG